MEIPFKRIKWNEYEAVLLIDTFEQVQSGLMSRNKGVSILSKRLRAKLLNENVEISDLYRNESGISLQLLSVEQYAKDPENDKASQLFRFVLDTSRKYRKIYEEKLAQAKEFYPKVETSDSDSSDEPVGETMAQEEECEIENIQKTSNLQEFLEYAEKTVYINNFLYAKGMEVDKHIFFVDEDGMVCNIVPELTMSLLPHHPEKYTNVVSASGEVFCAFPFAGPVPPSKEQLKYLILEKIAYDKANELIQTIVTEVDEDDLQTEYNSEDVTLGTGEDRGETDIDAEDDFKETVDNVNSLAFGEPNKTSFESPFKGYDVRSMLECASKSVYVKKYLEEKGWELSEDSFYVNDEGIVCDAMPESLRDIYAETLNNYTEVTTLVGDKFFVYPYVGKYPPTADKIVFLILEKRAFDEANTANASLTSSDEEKQLTQYATEESTEFSSDDYVAEPAGDYKKLEQVKSTNKTGTKTFQPVSVSFLVPRILANEKAWRIYEDYDEETIELEDLLYSANGKVCHLVPKEQFMETEDDYDRVVITNPHGVSFVSWYANAMELTSKMVVDLLKESILFRTLKPAEHNVHKTDVEWVEKETQTVFEKPRQAYTLKKQENVLPIGVWVMEKKVRRMPEVRQLLEANGYDGDELGDLLYIKDGSVCHVLKSEGAELSGDTSYCERITASNGEEFITWYVDYPSIDEQEIIDLIREAIAFKSANVACNVTDSVLVKNEQEAEEPHNGIETNQVCLADVTKREYVIPDSRTLQPLSYGKLERKIREVSAAYRMVNQFSPLKREQQKLIFTREGYVCHIVPAKGFVAIGDDSQCRCTENDYGQTFVYWFADERRITSDEVVALVQEFIAFHTLKTDEDVEQFISEFFAKKENKGFRTHKEPVVEQSKAHSNIASCQTNTTAETSVAAVSQTNRKEPDERFMRILSAEPFARKGFRLGSRIERSRFAREYYNLYDEEVGSVSDYEFNEAIKQCGFEYNERVYVPSVIIDRETKSALYQYIDQRFSDGDQYIYFDKLFEHFEDLFGQQTMLDPIMLRHYIHFYNDNGELYFDKLYFSKGEKVVVDVNAQVLDFVKEQGGWVSQEQVVEALDQLRSEDVIKAFTSNSSKLISAGRGIKFHIDNFQLDEEERTDIEDFLKREIAEYKFVTFSELKERMQIATPRVVDNNEQFGDVGIRMALSNLLGCQFNFTGRIISDLFHPVQVRDVFVDFGRDKEEFSIEDVLNLASDFDTQPNFDALSEHNVRVSEERFVSKSQVHFNVEEVDNAISSFCNARYVPFNAIVSFASFPECGYSWNMFLLESYLNSYSMRFELFHKRFNVYVVTGAIISKPNKFDSYEAVMADAVAQTEIKLNKESVQSFLVDNDYLAKNKLDTIDDVIRLANQLRKN